MELEKILKPSTKAVMQGKEELNMCIDCQGEITRSFQEDNNVAHMKEKKKIYGWLRSAKT